MTSRKPTTQARCGTCHNVVGIDPIGKIAYHTYDKYPGYAPVECPTSGSIADGVYLGGSVSALPTAFESNRDRH